MKPLTERELEVMRAAAEGLTHKEVGEKLGMSGNTVRTHVQRVLTKLDAANTTQAIAMLFRQGFLR